MLNEMRPQTPHNTTQFLSSNFASISMEMFGSPELARRSSFCDDDYIEPFNLDQDNAQEGNNEN